MKQMKRIQCLLDCFACIVEEDSCFDYRPLYMGVWNEPFDVNERGISYYSYRDNKEHKNWQARFEQLYGNAVSHWSNYDAGKYENFSLFKSVSEKMHSHDRLIVKADLFYLPYFQYYQVKHTPHFLIVDHAGRNGWYIKDPYLYWEGYVDHETMWESFCFLEVAWGVKVDTRQFREPSVDTVSRIFAEEIDWSPNKLVIEVEAFMHKNLQHDIGNANRSLFASLEQVGIISKRLGGYEPVYRYFTEGDEHEAEEYMMKIADLLKGWESILLSIARLDILGRRADMQSITEKLRRIEHTELAIKSELSRAFALWKGRNF